LFLTQLSVFISILLDCFVIVVLFLGVCYLFIWCLCKTLKNNKKHFNNKMTTTNKQQPKIEKKIRGKQIKLHNLLFQKKVVARQIKPM
jgi:predicted membrane protein